MLGMTPQQDLVRQLAMCQGVSYEASISEAWLTSYDMCLLTPTISNPTITCKHISNEVIVVGSIYVCLGSGWVLTLVLYADL